MEVSADSQVAYQVDGKPRSIMEAAAAQAFQGVPGPVVQGLLDDIKAGKQKTRAESVLTLINAHKDTWKWTEVDVARAMMRVLPEFSAAAERRFDLHPQPSDAWVMSLIR